MRLWHGTALGFTLVEMSVVLTVIALITAMSMAVGSEAMESARRVSTEKKMDVIEDAMLLFRRKYARLPCPASATLATTDNNFGIEATTPVTSSSVTPTTTNASFATPCTTGTPAATYTTTTSSAADVPYEIPSGAIPVRTLGLPDDFMYDAWGRKMMYEVTSRMTVYDAFFVSHNDDSCAISVQDNSGTALPIRAVYALVSHGKNGIGGYLATGTQISGTAGTAEQTNIRSTTTSATIRLKNGISGTIGDAGYYDDIVRVKHRYQLMDFNDRNEARHSGPDMAYAADIATNHENFYFARMKCGEYQQFVTSPPVLGSGTMASVPPSPSGTPVYVAFTPSNQNLLAISSSAVAATGCKMYSISGTTIAAVSAATPLNCSSSGNMQAAMAVYTGTLMMNATAAGATAPLTRFYTLGGSGASARYMEIPTANPQPGLTATIGTHSKILSISGRGEYYTNTYQTGADGSSTGYINKYRKIGGVYQYLGAFTGEPAIDYRVYNEISPNARYYMVIDNYDSNKNNIYAWRNVNGAFQRLNGGTYITPTNVTHSQQNNRAKGFSKDARYFAAVGASSGTYSSTLIYQVNHLSDSFRLAARPNLSPTPFSMAFSHDGRSLILSDNGGTSNGTSTAMRILRRNPSDGGWYILPRSMISSTNLYGALLSYKECNNGLELTNVLCEVAVTISIATRN